jgi:chromosome segregation ATPase
MGLPSLFEDILDKQLDNLLRDQIGNGTFFSKDELKKFLRQVGVSARYLFAVNDEKLIEMWTASVAEVNELRDKNSKISNDLAVANELCDKLRVQLDEELLMCGIKSLSSDNNNLRSKIKKLNQDLNAKKREISQIESEKIQISKRYDAQIFVIAKIEAQNSQLESQNATLKMNLRDLEESHRNLLTEVNRCRAELEEMHREKMKKILDR